MSGYGGFGGGPNMQNLMRQAQKMQEQMMQAQKELEETEFTATSGGGMVEIKMTGKKELLSIKLAKQAVDPDDVEMLEDLIKAAFNDALKQVETTSQEKMGGFGGGALGGLF